LEAKVKLFRYLLVVSIILIFIIGCGGSKYLNKNYLFEQPKSGINLAIIPITSNHEEFIDSAFAVAFKDEEGIKKLLRPAILREKIISDEKLINIINKIIANDHSKNDLKGNPNILNLITEDEMKYLEKSIDSSTYLLVPVIFGTKPLINNTFGNSRIRLYDVRTEILIYEINEDVNANLGGEDGQKYIEIILASMASQDFNKYFVNRFQ
jgi:hypothetical protein